MLQDHVGNAIDQIALTADKILPIHAEVKIDVVQGNDHVEWGPGRTKGSHDTEEPSRSGCWIANRMNAAQDAHRSSRGVCVAVPVSSLHEVRKNVRDGSDEARACTEVQEDEVQEDEVQENEKAEIEVYSHADEGEGQYVCVSSMCGYMSESVVSLMRIITQTRSGGIKGKMAIL